MIEPQGKDYFRWRQEKGKREQSGRKTLGFFCKEGCEDMSGWRFSGVLEFCIRIPRSGISQTSSPVCIVVVVTTEHPPYENRLKGFCFSSMWLLFMNPTERQIYDGR